MIHLLPRCVLRSAIRSSRRVLLLGVLLLLLLLLPLLVVTPLLVLLLLPRAPTAVTAIASTLLWSVARRWRRGHEPQEVLFPLQHDGFAPPLRLDFGLHLLPQSRSLHLHSRVVEPVRLQRRRSFCPPGCFLALNLPQQVVPRRTSVASELVLLLLLLLLVGVLRKRGIWRAVMTRRSDVRRMMVL